MKKLLSFHNKHKKIATLTAVRPLPRFGNIKLDKNKVSNFSEKDRLQEGWINGGFFVIEPKFLNFIKNDKTLLEREPLELACKKNQLYGFKHEGFWQCMDTKRDKDNLEFLLKKGKLDLAYLIQMLVSNKFSVDIHPFATIGKGILMDHAHGIVIGETAKIGDNVSLLHSVTLGGTGKEEGDRHPKIGNGVLLGAGAKVLGNIKIGDCAKVASGSVVLTDVPERKTVAGIPAKIVGEVPKEILPSKSMDHEIITNE